MRPPATRRLALLAALAGLSLSACSKEGRETSNGASVPREMSGKQLYDHWCADCHNPGPGHPGTLRLAGDMGEENSVLLQKQMDPEVVKYAVRNGFQMMPPFRPTEITDEELARLTDYLVKKQ
ncbi:MAG TPA: cytochrome c [Sphingobium sp.]|nr:cytochrome c [Sphingobium sp.]